MTLYRATKDGEIPLTDEEETALRAEWAENEKLPKPKHRTLEERISDIEADIKLLKAK